MNLNKEIEELLKKYPDPRQKNKGVLEFARKLYYASCPPQTCGLLPEFCGQNSNRQDADVQNTVVRGQEYGEYCRQSF